jgi:Flp pilus assembly pilin Flp
MNLILAVVRKFTTRAEAATLIEYGLVLLLVALRCVGVVSYIGSSEVLPMFQSIIPAF